MINKTLLAFGATLLALPAHAENVPINGLVQSKCTIVTETTGVYGNPTNTKLSTLASEGGVLPIMRYGVVSGENYKARISTPTSFSSSPTLSDVVNWTGSTSVSEVSVAGMSAYDTNKVVFNNVTEFNLTLAGSTWFASQSTAKYGFNKSLPAGNYNATVLAECIAL